VDETSPARREELRARIITFKASAKLPSKIRFDVVEEVRSLIEDQRTVLRLDRLHDILGPASVKSMTYP
jgi:hypothetical protein